MSYDPKQLTVEQKIGQMLCFRGAHKESEIPFALELIKNHALGCVQVVLNDKTKKMVERLQSAADYPILFINDMERGYPPSKLPKIPLMTLAACPDPAYLRAFAEAIVAEAKADGLSGCWGPVLDVIWGDGPVRIGRTFGNNPDRVSACAAAIAEVFAENNFLGSGKHYPGCGRSEMDTHMAAEDIDLTMDDLFKVNLAPYRYLIERDLLPSVMVDHGIFTAIDPDLPASLSKKALDILRRDLGYDGLVYTDSLAMMAILQKYGDKCLGMAAGAGNDIILPDYRISHKQAYEQMLQNYRDGLFTEEQLDNAARRIHAAQQYIAQPPKKKAVITEQTVRLLDATMRDCITALCDDGLTAALPDPNKRRLFVVLTPQGYDQSAPITEITSDKWYKPERVAAAIKENFPTSDIFFLPEFPTPSENDQALTRAIGFDEVVLVTYCETAAYMGTDSMTRRAEALCNALILSDKVSAVVHFGNPYALVPLKHSKRKLFGYTAPASQLYAMQVLAGKIPARGVLPFDIDFQ